MEVDVQVSFFKLIFLLRTDVDKYFYFTFCLFCKYTLNK